MKNFFLLFLLAASLLTFSVEGNSMETENTVQIAILLDTSGSMEGLIEQAKTQLWKIINELARSKRDGESINLQVALYEYGKSSIPAEEGYIRMIIPLSTDLDKISDELFKLQTNGGDEYCGEVIQSAVTGLQWSKSNDELKIIVIAGNEPFTQGDVDYRTACKAAISNGIIINTIFCGNMQEGINTNWKDGADLADGKYMNIDHNQQIVHINAPQDAEIALLGAELNNTYLAYGGEGENKKELQAEQDSNSYNLGSGVMAERAVAKASSQYRNASWDLVDAEEEGEVNLDEMDVEDLPEEMKNLNTGERKEYIEKKRKERADIQEKINQLNEERRNYIAEKTLELNSNTFDSALIEAIKEQAKSKNYTVD